ncbi:unnamed protein product [Rotaria socialis]|uniref:Uncharacterized protein n=1 Tax=Rotaria socialis TaxID=392032 RepID=A0A818LMP0_9BILA|nr:unnamed protein product [Rotaria socialis]CAF3381878.1 unnamed protein product [Rotaria socialis]CAF3571006.1 unnamed protein product [Rotaria socialis]CAF4284657.1 unnamed protein product [Rotaria socialis]CAF4428591.1 unnamed protein product [Rotaria socialis]
MIILIGDGGWPFVSSRASSSSVVIAAFLPGSPDASVAQAVNATQLDPNAIPDLKSLSITVRSKSYSISSSSSSTTLSTQNNTENTNVGLIVGLVVGIVCGLALLFGIVVAVKVYENKYGGISADRNETVNLRDFSIVHNEHDSITPPQTKGKRQSRIIKLPPISPQHLSNYGVYPPMKHDKSDHLPGALFITSLEDEITHEVHDDPTDLPIVERM